MTSASLAVSIIGHSLAPARSLIDRYNRKLMVYLIAGGALDALPHLKQRRARKYPVFAIAARLPSQFWRITGPFFNYSDTCRLVINTGTTSSLFLIQNTSTGIVRCCTSSSTS